METPIHPFHTRLDDEGVIIQPWDIEHLSDVAWELTRCALWPTHNFCEEETEATKDYLRDYFLAAGEPNRAFIALCQRVILAQRYERSFPHCYALTPSAWFLSKAPFGFVATMSWLQRVEQKRQFEPYYLVHIRALAECLFEFAKEPSSEQFRKGCAELLRHRGWSLLVLFTACTAYKFN